MLRRQKHALSQSTTPFACTLQKKRNLHAEGIENSSVQARPFYFKIRVLRVFQFPIRSSRFTPLEKCHGRYVLKGFPSHRSETP